MIFIIVCISWNNKKCFRNKLLVIIRKVYWVCLRYGQLINRIRIGGSGLEIV